MLCRFYYSSLCPKIYQRHFGFISTIWSRRARGRVPHTPFSCAEQRGRTTWARVYASRETVRLSWSNWLTRYYRHYSRIISRLSFFVFHRVITLSGDGAFAIVYRLHRSSFFLSPIFHPALPPIYFLREKNPPTTPHLFLSFPYLSTAVFRCCLSNKYFLHVQLHIELTHRNIHATHTRTHAYIKIVIRYLAACIDRTVLYQIGELQS